MSLLSALFVKVGKVNSKVKKLEEENAKLEKEVKVALHDLSKSANQNHEVLQEKKEPTFVNKLEIWSGTNYKWEYRVDVSDEKSKIKPWKEFYQWYFGRPQSPNFRMIYIDGETMLKREDISTFSVKISKK